MKREYQRWYSQRLGLELGVVVYGHWGPPLLGFPTSAGDEWELEGQGMVGALGDFIDGGKIKLYTVDPKQHLQADRDAESRGLEIIGVFHSHTHTDAYPSPTDVAQAPDPQWRYVIVSLKDAEPVLRCYRIVEGVIEEEPVQLDGR